MNSDNHPDERLKLHEAVFATALVVAAAPSVAVAFTFLAARAYAVNVLDHIKSKRKGGTNVQ